MKKRLSVVIPVYNEEEIISLTFQKLLELKKDMLDIDLSSIQLIFIDDGSDDCTYERLCKEKEVVSNQSWVEVMVVKFSRNFGHSPAVLAGLHKANGDIVAIIDADLQDPPELIPKMIAKLYQGWDVVYGRRTLRKGETISKRITAWTFYRLLNFLSGVDIPKDSGDFRVMTRQVVEAIKSCDECDPFLRGIVAWVGFNQVDYLYVRNERVLGESKYGFSKMIKFATAAIVSFSSLPLRLAAYIGIAGIVTTTLLCIFALYVKVGGDAVPGWASLVFGFAFGQSITFVIIGIIGTYIGRIHKELQKRPQYIIREINL